MMNFPCDKCGACCRNVGKQVRFAQLAKDHGDNSDLVNEILNFPYRIDEKGVCEKLVDNQCSVYDSRPDVCSVKRIWEKYLYGTMELTEWYKLNRAACLDHTND